MSEKPAGALTTVPKRVKKAFIAYIDTHVGAAIAEKFLSLNYEVSAMCKSATIPTGNALYSKLSGGVFPRTSDPEAIRRALLEADVIVYHTPGCAEDSVRALRVLESSVFDTSNEKRFILVSSTQSWFETTAMSTSPAQLAQQQNFVISEDTTDEDIAALLEGVSEDQYNRRIPHVRHQAWRDVEKMCAATNSEGRVRTFVVFAGLVYGNGEDFLLPYFKQAWSLSPAGLPIYGSGNQIIPMIHVADLTTFVQELSTNETQVIEESFPRYLFAADDGQHTWRSVVKALNAQLGNGRTFDVPPHEFGLYENVEQFTINLRVEPGQLQELVPEENWQCKSGFVVNATRVVQEFRTNRGLTPHRVVIVGPPSSGKTYIGKHLSELYQVPHLTISDIIAEYRYQEAELLEAIAVRKEERLAHRKAERLEEKRRQFLEDKKNGIISAGDNNNDDDDEYAGDNSKHHNNQHAKIDPDDDEVDSEADDEALAIQLSDEELKEITELVDEENNSDETIQMMNDKIAEVKRVCAMKWKPISEETQEPVNPRDKLRAGARQSSGIGANAAGGSRDGKKPAAPTAAAAAGKKVAGGGAGAGRGGVGKGNAAEIQEESEEEKVAKSRLSDRALGFMVRWKLSTAAACRNQGYILDGFPKTVRQARLVFEDAEHDVPEDPENEPDLPLDKEVKPVNNAIFPEYVIQLSADDDFLLHRLLRTQNQAAHNVPEHFQRRLDAYKANFDVSNSVIHFFESARTAVNDNNKTARSAHVKHVAVDHEPLVPEDIPPPPRVSQFDAKQYPPLALKIGELIGAPRNLGPSPADALREAQRARNLAEEVRNIEARKQQEKAQREAEELAAVRESRKQLDEKAKRLQSVERQMLEERKAPLKAYLMHNVIPVLTKGLMEVCIRQPDDPVEFLAEWLFRHNPEDHPEMYS